MVATVNPGEEPRGIRNHNPGNVRASPAFKWMGQIGTDAKGFIINKDPVFGLRQIMVIFHNYQLHHNLRSTYQLITRWAPNTENDTADYARFMAGRLFVALNDPIDIRDVWCRWTHGIVMYECGQDPYSIDQFNFAHKLAFESR